MCPRDFCDEYPLVPSKESDKSQHFRTATGARVRNEGQRTIRGMTEDGQKVAMRYAVADIAVPLESVAQICDSGATVTFNAKGGKIEGPKGIVTFSREGDTYVRKTWIQKPSKPFSRQRQN